MQWAPGGTGAHSEHRRGGEPRNNGAAGVWHPWYLPDRSLFGEGSWAWFCSVVWHPPYATPLHSALCPRVGAPRCPELTRSRGHLHQRSHGRAGGAVLSPSLARWGPARHGVPRALGPGHAPLGMLLTGELWMEMAPLIPEDGPHFGGSCICEAAIGNNAPLPGSLSQSSACHGATWPGSQDTFPREPG